ncbi:MAG: thioesterase family protein [Myxococcota bacterium]|nr:thioesterase family protein [Myxococcota bacterium]
MTDFDAITTWLVADDGGSWSMTVGEDWGQGRAAFGGVLTAAALKSMRSLVARDRIPRSIVTSFIGPLRPAPATLTARIVRTGRALTSAEARITQNGSDVALLQASFGAARPSGVRLPLPVRPQRSRPAPDSSMPFFPGITPAFTEKFAYHWTDGQPPFSGHDTPYIGGWCRHRTPATDGFAAVVALLDAWPAPILSLLTAPAPASTVSWTAHFIDVPDVTPDDWFWFDAEAVTASDGYATTRGRLFAPDGRLAAHMEQRVVVFDKR